MMLERYARSFALLLAVLPAESAAQSAVLATNRGWLGIEVEQRSEVRAALRRMVVVRVDGNSPAEEAGVRAGDVLVGLDGAAASMDVLGALARRIRPGTPVPITIRREGEMRTLIVTAGVRPVSLGFRSAEDIADQIDSARNEIFRRMDSLMAVGLDSLDVRVGQVQRLGTVVISMGDSLRTFRFPRIPVGSRIRAGRQTERRSPAPRAPRIEYSFRFVPPAEPYPVEAFFFSSEEAEILRSELQQVRAEISRNERIENQRQRELADRLASGITRIDTSDARLVDLRERLDELRLEARRVEEEMASTSRRAMVVRESLERIPALAPLSDEPRFRTPHLLGQRFVAGAELTALSRELAEYFAGEEGLLVTQVVTSSPADRAGLLPGDVITMVGGEVVRTVAEFRLALARSDGEAEMQVVRREQTVTMTLPR